MSQETVVIELDRDVAEALVESLDFGAKRAPLSTEQTELYEELKGALAK